MTVHAKPYRCACLSDDLDVMATCARDYYFVRCTDCHATGPRARSRDAAVARWNAALKDVEDMRRTTRLLERAARDAARAERRAATEARRAGHWSDPAVRTAVIGAYVGHIQVGRQMCQAFEWETATGRRRGNAQAFIRQFLAPTFGFVPSAHAYSPVLKILHEAGKGCGARDRYERTGANDGHCHCRPEHFVDLPPTETPA